MGLSTLEVVAQGSPVVLSTLFRHFLNKKKTTKDSKAREELLFDEAFTVMKSFLEIATKNTVEDLQRFSNTRIPSPPSILVLPILIPLSSCHTAAEHLLRALGGPEHARKIVGGQEWWQVRGVKGVEGEWIVVKKDWEAREKEEREREKEREKIRKEKVKHATHPAEQGADRAGMTDDEIREEYAKEEMDEMRCMLYIHGGAYYWGSINTHRYTIWRYARKMKGRCFAVNYRKAPQYPFPCALQDCLAAYLYLLNPPPEAKHKPIPASQIVIAGDSAGGGLTLALLQVLRDAGLEMPAGAIAISPWGDLTHCFPSTMENFATDVMPPYGFIHKPSTLWPPPPPELSESVQSTLRSKVREAATRIRTGEGPPSPVDLIPSDSALHRVTSRGDTNIVAGGHRPSAPEDESSPGLSDEPTATGIQADGKTTSKGDDDINGRGGDKVEERQASRALHPTTNAGKDAVANEHKPVATTSEGKTHQHHADPTDGKDMVIDIDGEKATIRGQIQLYATNAQLPHPYVSPCWGYLGGLCPILVIASDKELLRDEIVYIAHKAAHPERYPVPDHVRKLMPCLDGIEDRYGPTKIHLQVYDEVCHVLPLYSMTTPAKYCFRAIANFAKYVTGPSQGLSSDYTSPPTPISTSPLPSPAVSRASSPAPPGSPSPVISRSASPQPITAPAPPSPSITLHQATDSPMTLSPQATLDLKTGSTDSTSSAPTKKRVHLSSDDAFRADRQTSKDVAGPRFGPSGEDGPETAGHPAIYAVGGRGGDPFVDAGMIRERVSTRGVLRPLESESDLPALHLPSDELGMIKELPAKRYLTGQGLWDVRYSRAAKTVEQHRKKNLERSKKDGAKIIQSWSDRLHQQRLADPARGETRDEDKFLMGSQGWSWNWALQGENPPPSAVVSRRDTNEARKLAQIADQCDDGSGSSPFGGVNLWTLAVNLLSPGSSSNSPKSHDHSGSASPVPSSTPLPPTSDKSRQHSLRAEEAEPRSRKLSSLKLPAFLRKKSAVETETPPQEPVKTAKVEGLPPPHVGDIASADQVGASSGPKPVEGAPVAPLGKEIA